MDSRQGRIARTPGVRWWRLGCWLLLMLAAAPRCSPSNPLLLSGEAAVGKAPGNLGEINAECWDAASLAIIEARMLRVADSVGAFWDFMTYLRASQQPKHHELFMKLAQLFWERYVDCAMARAHGLGRRAHASRRGVNKVL